MKKGAVGELVSRLEAVYGLHRPFVGIDPLEELVACILSQNTNDKNSGPAYVKLREKYPTWPQVVAADPEDLADTIRIAGLANQKAAAIQKSLVEINHRNGGYHLDNLDAMPVLEARSWLISLPGVGPKTASIVLCFALGKGVIPVDTHVFRVGWRLGLYPEKTSEAKAHDLLLELVPPDLAFRYHMAVIQHGRAVCRAPVPNCAVCAITDLCRYYRSGAPAKHKAAMERKRANALTRFKKPATSIAS